MKKKSLILSSILAAILFAIYYLFFMGGPFPETIKIILVNRRPLTASAADFAIRPEDKLKEITSPGDLALVNDMTRIRRPFIVKDQFIGKAITANNDTIDIIIAFPGPFVIEQQNGRKFGFSSKEKQNTLTQLLRF